MAETRKPDSGPLGHKNKNAYIQPAESTCTFPFEKLPAELQVMVIRLTMPQKGLRFQREDRKYYNATRGKRKWWYSWTRQEDSVPTALFLTNHHLSAIALDTLYREVHREQTWKKVKAMKRPTGRETRSVHEYFRHLRDFRLQIDDTTDELFEHWTKVAVEGLEKWYEQWELEKTANSANKVKSPE
ncbi:MAG: hypothetical protein Q9199_003445 [Rusavskia elegans]